MPSHNEYGWTIGAELKFIEGLGSHSDIGKRMGPYKCLVAYKNVLEKHHPRQDSHEFKEVIGYLRDRIAASKKGGRRG
jgi:hypothetical protein